MRHLTIRFAWHDNKWNGKICKAPSDNVYCVDNFSLLSSRIQRRRNIGVEEKFKGATLSEVKEKTSYLPPCYWCINALGAEKYYIEDIHPFSDTWEKFGVVPPIAEMLDSFSVFTWNFKLSFMTSGAYRYPPDLEDRVRKYITSIEAKKSIAFFYANYSNPITGDERKYLVLGAGLVREDIKFPKKYDIPKGLYEEINRNMPVFPEIAWQFQIPLDPEHTFVLPYHEYLQFIDRKDGIKREDKEKWLEEITVKVDDPTIIPHFKYVSMHLPHDKAIYLLYRLKKGADKLQEHGVVSINEVKRVQGIVDKLLEIAWKERGQYPGFDNLLTINLGADFGEDQVEKLVKKLKTIIIEKFGSVDNFLNDKMHVDSLQPEDPELEVALGMIRSQYETFKFMARFDFSRQQFKNVIDFISKKGFNNFRANPYSLLEEYSYDIKDDWDIDKNDYGMSIYQLDVALIPDPRYAKWERLYTAKSMERVRALVTMILRDEARNNGHTYLTRDKIVEKIKDYPLYYVQRELEIEPLLLSQYEGDPRFKEYFKVMHIEEQTIYQLKSLEGIEKIIETFIKSIKGISYSIDNNTVNLLLEEDIKNLEDRLKDPEVFESFINERTKLYRKALNNKLLVVSGRAGSGKTSALINLINVFRKQGKTPIYVFTPTGKASLVIRRRLKEMELGFEQSIKVSTIHRFIYRELSERTKGLNRNLRSEIFKLVELADKIFGGQYEFVNEFNRLAKRWQFHPRVVIIDEASMVDEILLALLLSLIDHSNLHHLIIVGDDKQLPPIGIGRPFIDLIYYLKNQGLDNNYQHLTINLRFPPIKDRSIKVEELADLFRGEKEPLLKEIDEIIRSVDDTLEVKYFMNIDDLKVKLKHILQDIINRKDHDNLQELFCHIFESEGNFNYDNLEKVQIITPKRVGKFGSIVLNREVILEGQSIPTNGVKIICEENQYWKVGNGREVLALANGSIGYLTLKGDVMFLEIDELLELFPTAKWQIYEKLKEVRRQLLALVEEIESPYTPAYSITVHKSQGSDFDYVIFILSERTPFITRELLYTGFTRAKRKMYLLIHEDLKDELYDLARIAYVNSQIESINTLLFGHKNSPSKPYLVELRNGCKVAVKSKIEYMIAKSLDALGVEFIYEPENFLAEYNIKPDFKIFLKNGNVFWWEHLGRLDNDWYRNKWFRKYKIYKELGIEDFLITTSESDEEMVDVESKVKNIIRELEEGSIRITEGSYSKHHYVL